MSQAFTFKEEYMDALDKIPDKDVRYEVMDAIITFGSKGIILEGMSPYAEAMFCLIHKGITTNLKKREGGLLGGRPKKAKNESDKGGKKADTDKITLPKKKRPNVPYKEIVESYNSICKSLPAVTELPDSRKTAIRFIYYKYGLDKMQTAFSLAEQSDFLKGNNERGWHADFDFLMREKKFVRLLEGGYVNHYRGSAVQNQDDLQGHYSMAADWYMETEGGL